MPSHFLCGCQTCSRHEPPFSAQCSVFSNQLSALKHLDLCERSSLNHFSLALKRSVPTEYIFQMLSGHSSFSEGSIAYPGTKTGHFVTQFDQDLIFTVQLFSKMSPMFAQSSYLVYPTRFSDCLQNYWHPQWTSMTKIWKMRHWREYETIPHHSANKWWFFHFHIFPLSHWVTHVCVCFACPCEGGQLLSDWRIRATDSLPGVHTRQSSGDPQHLFLLHQLCRGSVGHIWSRLCLIAPDRLFFFFSDCHLEINIFWHCPLA